MISVVKGASTLDMSLRGTMGVLRRFPVLYGLAWSLFLALVGILCVAVWAHYGSPSDSHILVAAYVIHCLAIFLGGISGSRAAAERGWFYGGMVGLLYALVMIGIGLVVFTTFSMDPSGLFRLLLMCLIGCFGGIIGVNTVSD
jgi:putative membrane protein (TIGR04086 family)